VTRANDVWVLLEAEGRKLSASAQGLLQEGKRLADALGGDLSAILLGPDVEKLTETVGGCGTRRLYRHQDERLERYSPEIYTGILSVLMQEHTPRLFLAAASSLGADLMPRVAATLGVPLVTNCLDVLVGDEIAFTKAVQSGRLQATIAARASGTCMATLDPDALPAPSEASATQAVEVCKIDTKISDISTSLHVSNYLKADPKTVDIREAEIVVAIGNGIGAKDNLSAFENFAAAIGAAIGGGECKNGANGFGCDLVEVLACA